VSSPDKSLQKSRQKSRTLASSAILIALAATSGFMFVNNNPGKAVPHVPETLETTTQPLDNSMRTTSEAETSRLDKAMQPYVVKARAGLPGIKKRFDAGLKDEVLMLTLRVYDPNGKYEQVFATVKKWDDKGITGIIASDVMGIKSHKMGDEINFPEKDVLDWTIEKSDGTEEGNVVGNFLNTFK
jgi:uncharacterized protein YegJ (DUF2314 family)